VVEQQEKKEIIQGLQTRLGLGIGGDLLVHIAAKADTFSIDQYGKSLTATSQKNALFALTYSIMNDKNLDNEQKALALDYLRQRYTSGETVRPGELGQDIEQIKQVKTGPDLGSMDPDYVRQHYDEIAERIKKATD